MDSLDCSPISACEFGASDLDSVDEVRNPYLHVSPPLQPSAPDAAASLAGRDDQYPVSRVSHRSALVP
jgi:hypothetical protein